MQLPSRLLRLSPRWIGHVTVLVRMAPNTYCLHIPASTSSVCGSTPQSGSPGQWSAPTAGQSMRCSGLKFKIHRGLQYMLIQWAGHDASGDIASCSTTRQTVPIPKAEYLPFVKNSLKLVVYDKLWAWGPRPSWSVARHGLAQATD